MLKERSQIFGGDSGGEPPVPIPNTEVKPASADGTWGAGPWESRTLPDINLGPPEGGPFSWSDATGYEVP